MAMTQLERLKRRFGSAFSDVELEAYLDNFSDDFDLTLYEIYDTLLANASKLTRYTNNDSTEHQEQVFEHLMKLRDDIYDKIQNRKKNRVMLVSAKSTPPTRPARPAGLRRRDDEPYREAEDSYRKVNGL